MTKLKIEQCFKKVDRKLMGDLEQQQRSEAVGQFRQLWQKQMSRVSIVINRRNKVQSNRFAMEYQEHVKKDRIAQEIKEKMQKHGKKRSTMQLQRLKSCKNMDKQWKNKMLDITRRSKKDQKEAFQKSQEFNKNIQKFWESRYSPRSPKSSKAQISQRNIQKQQQSLLKHFTFGEAKEQNNQPNFMTEVKLTALRVRRQRNSRSVNDAEFAQVDQGQKVNKQVILVKQISLRRNKTQVVNPYLQRSNHEWQKKEDACVQQAMEKIDKIMKARGKVVQKFKQTVKQTQQHRKVKNSKMKFQHHESVSVHSPHEQRHRELQKRETQMGKRSVRLSNHSSLAQLRHQQQLEEDYKLRGQIFDGQKLRQRRGRFHRMVRDAINIFRLQALRPKS